MGTLLDRQIGQQGGGLPRAEYQDLVVAPQPGRAEQGQVDGTDGGYDDTSPAALALLPRRGDT